MNKFDWINESKKGIDGYDIAAIIGLDKKRNALDVYIDKAESTKTISIKEDVLYWEIKLEDLIAREFSLRTGKKIRKDARNKCDEDYKYMISNIDRRIIGENSILECKVIKNDQVEDFEEKLVNNYLIQAQHNMKVTGADSYYIAALINSERFIYKKINRDNELISKIIEIEKNFWFNHVEKRIKPNLNQVKQLLYKL